MNTNIMTSAQSPEEVASAAPEVSFYEEYTCESFGYETEDAAKAALDDNLSTFGYAFAHFFHEVQWDEASSTWGYVIYGSSE